MIQFPAHETFSNLNRLHVNNIKEIHSCSYPNQLKRNFTPDLSKILLLLKSKKILTFCKEPTLRDVGLAFFVPNIRLCYNQ
ncbi:hypothetical protein PJIAN_4830 [Paludibacter jiangxiensis]|uniref:Uncharacterized protein n=1 Tax=Paludibacter jiangxiensis TaxID=681398 RepID=A0A161LTH5_9BACT|nr:hypothetical protein PJIAN_4830 [Paludibacter jiangxiensis]